MRPSRSEGGGRSGRGGGQDGDDRGLQQRVGRGSGRTCPAVPTARGRGSPSMGGCRAVQPGLVTPTGDHPTTPHARHCPCAGMAARLLSLLHCKHWDWDRGCAQVLCACCDRVPSLSVLCVALALASGTNTVLGLARISHRRRTPTAVMTCVSSRGRGSHKPGRPRVVTVRVVSPPPRVHPSDTSRARTELFS
jgi:hypothetical protein